MATINFLPVCSNCHQVLWGEEIRVDERQKTVKLHRVDDLDDKPVMYNYLHQEVYPHMCHYCKEIFTTIEIPGGLPYVCEPLWPISAKEN